MSTVERSPFFGVSRRDFLKFCTAMAATIGMPGAVTEVAAALEEAARRPQVIWTTFQACTGCAVQLLESRTPPVAQLILQQISVEYQDNVMAASGKFAEEQRNKIVDSGDFFWIAEGSVATKEPGMCTIGGQTSEEIAEYVYANARGVLATGTCATHGNIQASKPNPSGAMGIGEYLASRGKLESGKPVVNLPRCPGNAEDLVAAFTYIAVNGEPPALDALGRPVFLYGQLIHDHCERRGHFEAGEFIEPFGDPESQRDWCWYKMGCKGPQTYAPCPITRWNGHLSWCVNNGPCIGCAEPDFWDEHTPFTGRSPAVNINGIGNVGADTIGWVAGGVAAAGIAAHAVGSAATGRFRKPPEPEERR